MSKEDYVNSQITDAIGQTNLQVVGEAPAEAVGMLYQQMAHSIGLALQNVISQQQHSYSIHNAITLAASRQLAKASGNSASRGSPSCNRFLNAWVFSISPSSLSASNSGSSALICSTSGRVALILRSFGVPKIFLATVPIPSIFYPFRCLCISVKGNCLPRLPHHPRTGTEWRFLGPEPM